MDELEHVVPSQEKVHLAEELVFVLLDVLEENDGLCDRFRVLHPSISGRIKAAYTLSTAEIAIVTRINEKLPNDYNDNAPHCILPYGKEYRGILRGVQDMSGLFYSIHWHKTDKAPAFSASLRPDASKCTDRRPYSIPRGKTCKFGAL